MAKKLKTFETSLGFFDLAIAAPSMKAALEAWGADSNLFHQGARGNWKRRVAKANCHPIERHTHHFGGGLRDDGIGAGADIGHVDLDGYPAVHFEPDRAADSATSCLGAFWTPAP